MVGAVSYWNAVRISELIDLRRRASLALLNLRGLSARLNEAESAARGYVLSGEERYLAPYHEGVAVVEKEIGEVGKLLEGDSLRCLAAIEDLIRQRVAHMAGTIALRREQGLEAAVARVRSGEGKRLMDSIASAIDALGDVQEREYLERNAAVQQGLRTTRVVIVLGNALAVVVVLTSILALRREMTARRVSETRYRTLFDASPDAIYTHDLDGRIISFNPAAERLTGYTRAEALGMNVSQLLSPGELGAARERAARLRSGEMPPEVALAEREIIAKDGRELIVEVASTVRREPGGVLEVQGIARDITERKLLEQQRAEFVAMLTHDIKNPLMVIINYLDMVRDVGLPPEALGLIERMESGAQTILSLVMNYLDLSRIEAGGFTLNRRRTSMNDAIRHVAKQYEAEAARRGLSLQTALRENLPAIEADPMALERVLANLVLNALKFTPEGGRVMVSSDTEAGDVVAVVSDTGPGIPAEEIPALFGRYKQTASGRAKRGGTGIGLFIVKSLVEAHGGSVSVNSAPAKGTSFHIRLPACAG
jgi:PAS domain S-box-containing protein